MPTNNTNPALFELFEELAQTIKTEMRVAVPATVVSYDSATNAVVVQPTIMRRRDGEAVAVQLPQIGGVPVMHPRTALAALIMPISAGDVVWLLFSDRDLQRWKAGAGVVPAEPMSLRMHDLADCVAIPGGYPLANPAVDLTGGAGLSIQVATGQVVRIGSVVTDAMATLSATLGELSTALQLQIDTLAIMGGSSVSVHTHNGNLGYPTSQPILDFWTTLIASLTASKATVDAAKTAIDALVT